MKKFRGRISMSFEALKDLLNLPDDIKITFVGQSFEDSLKEKFTIVVGADEETPYTYETPEDSMPILITNIGGKNNAKLQ